MLNISSRISHISQFAFSIFSLSCRGKLVKNFPLEKCIHLPGCDAYSKVNTFSIVSMCEYYAQCKLKIPFISFN